MGDMGPELSRKPPREASTVTLSEASSWDDRSSGPSRLLSCPDDGLYLSEVLCFVRSHIEVFLATKDDRDVALRKADGTIDVGRVGIRCKHCAPLRKSGHSGPGRSVSKAKKQTRYATSFPRSIRMMNQTVRNWQRFHLAECPAVPEKIRAEYAGLKGADNPSGISTGRLRRSSKDAPRYWEECCRKMGMIDTDSGIRLRDGIFLIENESAEERGNHESCDKIKVNERGDLKCSAGTNCWNGQSSDTTDTERFVVGLPLPVASTTEQRTLGVSPLLGADTLQTRRTNSNSRSLLEVPRVQLPTLGEKDTILPSIDSNASTAIRPKQTRTQTSSDVTSASSSSPNDILLGRVKMAQSMLAAIGQIRQLPPQTFPTNDEVDYSNSIDVHAFGAEVYELFSGQSPDGGISEQDVGNHSPPEPILFGEDSRRRQKKGKQRKSNRRTPLTEFSIPPSLCDLVSALLDHSEQFEQIDSNFVKEVKEDLHLMVCNPGRFLFRSETGVLKVDSNTLYGREDEMSALLGAYNQMIGPIMRGGDMVLVSGVAGTGKTSLITHMQRCFVERGACCVLGKFDAMQQLQPLSAVVRALDNYCDLLAQDTDRIHALRDAVSAAIGSGGGILTNLIPSLHKIMHAVGDMTVEVNSTEVMQQLMFQFRALLKVTCSRGAHPLVLFLDDLQWADSVSLDLMEALAVDSEIEGLLIVGGYRDNEVVAGHPLTMHLDSIRCSQCVYITNIHLKNLDTLSITSLLSETLSLTHRLTRPLAEVFLSKTGGNALFAVQFLASLYEEGLLYFSSVSRRWEWDIVKIRDKNIADNCVGLMTANLARLTPEVQQALRVAAAFGAQCQEVLFRILEKDHSFHRIVQSLDVAVAQGLMVKAKLTYRFSHDQVQHAAFVSIPELERERVHLRIGMSLWECASEEEMDLFIFVILDQLHRGSQHITDSADKLELSRLSLVAGQKASSISAYPPAAAFFKAGIGLLSEADWEHHRDLCFNLHNCCAEAECILGNSDSVAMHVDVCLKRAQIFDEKLRAYFALVQSMGAKGRLLDAINISITVLDYLGETLPTDVSEVMVQQELMITKDLLSRNTESLVELKQLKDTKKLFAMKFLRALLKWVYIARKTQLPHVACRIIRISLLDGFCKESATGFACFGTFLCAFFGDFEGGYALGTAALSIVEKFQAKDQLAFVSTIVYGFIFPWKQPIQATLPHLKEAMKVGMSAGDPGNAMTASMIYCGSALCSGQHLGTLLNEMEHCLRQMKEHKQYFVIDLQKPAQQAMLNLVGRNADPTKLVGEIFDEDQLLCHDSSGEVNESIGYRFRIYSYRMWLEYLFGEYERAFHTAKKNQDVKKHAVSRFPFVCDHVFYGGLAALALARKNGKEYYANFIDAQMAQMKVWAISTHWNCQHKLELMNAELAYLEGDVAEASNTFDRAIELAHAHSFIHEEAVAMERAGIFYQEIGDHSTAAHYFERAFGCYTKWGASSKAAQVQSKYLQK